MADKLLLKCGNIKETKAFYSELLEFYVSESDESTCTIEKKDGKIVFTGEDLWSEYRKMHRNNLFLFGGCGCVL